MGITKHAFYQMVKGFSSKKVKPSGKVLTLSSYTVKTSPQYFNEVCQKFNWDNRLNVNELFIDGKGLLLAMGFDSVDTMDYSNYQGAEIIHDLNNPNVPDKYLEKYDYIVDGGTLEHIFNVPNALCAIFKMLKTGGTFFFDQPIYYGVNHGFYNFSPCLFYEYFSQNNWEVNDLKLYVSKSSSGEYLPIDVPINSLRKDRNISFGNHFGNRARAVIWGCVTKVENSTCHKIPQQPIYNDQWDEVLIRQKKIDDVFASVAGSVYLYGAGKNAQNLIKTFKVNEKENFKGIIGLSSYQIGKTFMGITVHDVTVVQEGDAVIISSKMFQDDMYEKIKYLKEYGVDVIRVY